MQCAKNYEHRFRFLQLTEYHQATFYTRYSTICQYAGAISNT